MRISRKGIDRIRRGLLRSWQPGGSHRLRQQARRVSPDDQRLRTLHDAKGQLFLSGHSPLLGQIAVYRSTNRHDQFDVFVGGRKHLTGGPRKLANWIKGIAIISKTSHESFAQKAA
jgi:hypothetical protein